VFICVLIAAASLIGTIGGIWYVVDKVWR
jgi:hypothetical protein